MYRIEQMKKVQEEIYSKFTKNIEWECNLNEIPKLQTLQQSLKSLISIRKTEIKIINIKKIRDILIQINISSGKQYGDMQEDNISFKNVQKEGLELFKKKNADYGDAFAKYGIIGIVMRMEDKLHRIITLYHSSNKPQICEKIEDTLIDLHNYSAMGIMLIDE